MRACKRQERSIMTHLLSTFILVIKRREKHNHITIYSLVCALSCVGDGKDMIFDWKRAVHGRVKNYRPKHRLIDFDLTPHNIRVKVSTGAVSMQVSLCCSAKAAGFDAPQLIRLPYRFIRVSLSFFPFCELLLPPPLL